ncbi:MAG: CehA/McbA family metallohydrolase [Candidatus Hydrogenedentes bacterium]|nr:CehA/McbA family metallohydrolase [Candidatus Hydrogenedentota bacterium]
MRQIAHLLTGCLLAGWTAGCATTADTGAPAESPMPTQTAKEPEIETPPVSVPATVGTIDIDIANALGQNLPARIDLLDEYGSPPRQVEAPQGVAEIQVPTGQYRCYVNVYDEGIPVLAEILDVRVTEAAPAYVLVNLLEGSTGRLGVHAFDTDGDLAIDRVEIASGTSPEDATSIPGRAKLPFNKSELASGARWYSGELNAQSHFGTGTETVAELIRRAERAGLDFLAITDRNNMKSVYDPAYSSSKVVLIPAMEWGNQERGYALIYGPRTLPDPPSTLAAGQAECLRVQAQGGAFTVARPCFPDAPWQWGLQYVNAVQVWCRQWREVPPMSLQQLPEELKTRQKGALVQSIAAAAAAADLAPMSANVQSTRFWDYELVRGLMAAGLAGSNSGGPAVPMGSPVTYIYADNKSLPALMEGLRLGRTYLSSGLDGPKLSFGAQVLVEGGANVGIGGAVPFDVEVRFDVGVLQAQGKKLEVLLNGHPIVAKIIESDPFVTSFQQHPMSYGVYRVRVIEPPQDLREGFGHLEVLAMTSPIYAQNIAQEILWQFPNLDPSKTWVRVPADDTPEVQLPEEAPAMPIGTPWVRSPGERYIPPSEPEPYVPPKVPVVRKKK